MMWLVLLIAVLALALLVLLVKYRSGRGRQVLHIKLVWIERAGDWHVVLPKDSLVVAKMMLVLLWAAKLNWLLLTELPAGRASFHRLCRNLASSLAKGAYPSMAERLRASLQTDVTGLEGTLPGTELDLSLYYAPRAKVIWHLRNTLPSGLSLGDSVWSIASLLGCILEDVAPTNRDLILSAFSRLTPLLDDVTLTVRSLSGLQAGFAVANAIGAQAVVQSSEGDNN